MAAGLAFGMLFLATEAGAQNAAGLWTIGGGLGFSATPTTFVLDADAAYALDEHMSIGPRIQLGFSDDTTLVTPTLNFRYAFDLNLSPDAAARKLTPFLQAGIGLGYIRKETGSGHFDDTGFLFNLGGGIEWSLGGATLGSNLMFNILPSETAGENFYFSWQLITLRFSL
ncbi:MAG: hypothetical protein V3T01_02280 [Myxococcota bacterium]